MIDYYMIINLSSPVKYGIIDGKCVSREIRQCKANMELCVAVKSNELQRWLLPR